MTKHLPLPEPPVDWRMVAAVGLWSLTGLMAIVLAGRALAGAFDAPVGALVPGLATGFATLGSLGAWVLFNRSQDRRPSIGSRFGTGLGRRLTIGLASLTAPALIAWATTVSASPLAPGLVTGILVLGLTAVVVGEGVRIVPLAEPVAEPLAGEGTQPVGEDAADDMAAPIVDPPPLPVAGPTTREPVTPGNDVLDSRDSSSDDSGSDDSDVVQHCSRRREADGTERIEAVLVATFAPGERETALHLPIHPLLCAGPQVECEPLDDSDVTATVTAAHPYGVRVEVRRTSPFDDGLSVPVGIEIVAVGPAVNVA